MFKSKTERSAEECAEHIADLFERSMNAGVSPRSSVCISIARKEIVKVFESLSAAKYGQANELKDELKIESRLDHARTNLGYWNKQYSLHADYVAAKALESAWDVLQLLENKVPRAVIPFSKDDPFLSTSP